MIIKYFYIEFFQLNIIVGYFGLEKDKMTVLVHPKI